MSIRRALLSQVDEAVQRLCEAIQGLEAPERLPVDDWSAKDTLGHIAFWHESFARNVKALTEGRAPVVLEGRYPDLNRRSVERARRMGTGQIIGRLRRAHEVIRRGILALPAEAQIPYRKGSRAYTPDEHLVIVRDHILAHLKRIEKAQKRRRSARRPHPDG